MTAVLLAAAVTPGAGEGVIGAHHRLSHLVSFAAVAFAWTLALPRIRSVVVAAGVIAFGFAQEAIEIFGHAHPFELRDALWDGLGAAAGVAAARVLLAVWRQADRACLEQSATRQSTKQIRSCRRCDE
jgi:hypothetical protein